MTGGLACASSR